MTETKKSPANSPVKKADLPPISNQLAGTHISHFMTRNVIYATPTTSVNMAMQMMLTHKISGLAVVNASGACVGVYSEMDAMLQGAAQSLESPIRFTKPPVTVLSHSAFREALLLLVRKKLKRLPVVDESKRLVGIVSRRDIMRALFEDQKQKT